jgi:hypothetical protein
MSGKLFLSIVCAVLFTVSGLLAISSHRPLSFAGVEVLLAAAAWWVAALVFWRKPHA